MTTRTTVLYRPVGPKELQLIREASWQRFPPRLPEQPIFYPVLQEGYAVRIARDWNAKASGAGFVTRFAVDTEYLSKFSTHPAGGSQFTEYWIPAAELETFNAHICGAIEVIAGFRAEDGAWIKVYDLAEDTEKVELVQRATQQTSQFGVEPDVALYGSNEWWLATLDGRIPIHSIEGSISRLVTTGHGDWYEFEVESDGVKSQWTRLGDASFYEVGREVRIEYVKQHRRRKGAGDLEQKHVLRVLARSPQGAVSEREGPAGAGPGQVPK